MPLALVLGVFVPESADGGGVEDGLVGELLGGDQVFGPGAEFAAEPLGEWDTEAALGTLEQGGGDVLGQDCAEQGFAGRVFEVHVHGNAACEFDDAVIEERCAGLEAGLHIGAIDFGHYVIGEVITGVGQHHGADKALAIGGVFPVV